MLWSTAIIVLIILAFTAWLVVPIVASSSAGSSGQPLGVEGYPSSVSATGDDGRTRTLSVTLENAQGRGLDQLVSGDRLVVTGQGYDPDKGIYVAVCAIPDQVDTKPGPCLGGVPSTEVLDQAGVAAIEFAPSNWVNDDWAWRLFGARSFDDRDQGSFSAYIEVGEDPESGVDCAVDACGLYTRNDHTALDDRVQDLYVPVLFVK
ncbi:MAG: hypothetical protein HON64_03810 [Microbacteriaceae bacterium]|nr:hypothetical protein [Microbacteriaceae bacterium]